MTDFNNNENNATDAADGNEAALASVKKSTKPKDYVTKEQLTQEVLADMLELRDDGFFYWVKATVRSIPGDFAGTVNILTGRYTLVFKGTTYNGEHLAAFATTGVWPPVTRGRAPAVDADGNPIVKKVKEARVPRVAPVFSEEERAAAKAEHEKKMAALTATNAARRAAAEAKVAESNIVDQADAQDDLGENEDF